MKRLENKNIIVTGCNGNIGTKLCEELNKSNCRIFGIDYLEKNEQKFLNLEFYKCDLTKELDVNRAITNIYKKTNKIDCLIHLAGLDYKVESKEVNCFDLDEHSISPPSKVMKSVSANVSMAYNIIYGLLSRFLKQDESRIILIGSLYGSVSPNPKLYMNEDSRYFFQKPIEYSISKSIFPNLARYLCSHYSKKGLIVNNLEPHAIIDNPNKKFLKNFKQLSPMGRICKSEEIIDLIIYLITSKCLYLNGETITIDGGWKTN